ncbi:hypothetical protein ACWD6P_14860 [Streptomyces sp. NPDC002446]
MVTTWSTSGMSRARSSAGPLRVWWVAMVLFSLVYAHGVSAEGIAGHLGASAAASVVAEKAEKADEAAQAQAAIAPHGGGHGEHSHPAEDCQSGQPQQGPALAAPCASPLDGRGSSATLPSGAGPRADHALTRAVPRAPTGPGVLRI